MTDWWAEATQLDGMEPVYVNPLKKPARAVKKWVKENPLDAATLALQPIPVAGDIAGIANDIRHFAKDPSTITVPNVGMAMMGGLPWVPSLFGIAKRGASKKTAVEEAAQGPKLEKAPTGNLPAKLDDNQLAELEELNKQGYSTQEALKLIYEKGLEAEFTRRDVFRLGKDAMTAAAGASRAGRAANIITDQFGNVSRKRIVDTVSPLLKKVDPFVEWESKDKFSQDFFGGSAQMTEFNPNPKFDDNMTSYLSKKLHNPKEINEARQLISGVPEYATTLRYFDEDGRPKELWRSWIGDRDEVPQFEHQTFGDTPPDMATKPEDWANLQRDFDPEFDAQVNRASEMAEDAAFQYLEEPDAYKYLGVNENEAAKHMGFDSAEEMKRLKHMGFDSAEDYDDFLKEDIPKAERFNPPDNLELPKGYLRHGEPMTKSDLQILQEKYDDFFMQHEIDDVLKDPNNINSGLKVKITEPTIVRGNQQYDAEFNGYFSPTYLIEPAGDGYTWRRVYSD